MIRVPFRGREETPDRKHMAAPFLEPLKTISRKGSYESIYADMVPSRRCSCDSKYGCAMPSADQRFLQGKSESPFVQYLTRIRARG